MTSTPDYGTYVSPPDRYPNEPVFPDDGTPYEGTPELTPVMVKWDGHVGELVGWPSPGTALVLPAGADDPVEVPVDELTMASEPGPDWNR